MRRALLLVPFALAALLVGCATVVGGGATMTGDAATGDVVAPSTDASTGVPDDFSAAWLDGGRLIGLVNWSTPMCPAAASDVSLSPDGILAVTLVEDIGVTGGCADVAAQQVALVEVPAGVDPTADLEIDVTGRFTGHTRLAGAEGLSPGGETDFLPSAGWTGVDDQLVILTYGSSGCPPPVSSVESTGPAAVTVTFETPPADQICTADVAPRATLVTASGLEDGVTTQLTLAGGRDFEAPATIPVYGHP